jgi:anti-anti-sigma factor
MRLTERRLTRDRAEKEWPEGFLGHPVGYDTFDADVLAKAGIENIFVVHVEGALTNDSGALAARVRALAEQGERAIVIDLARVTVWDSAGLGELVRSYVAVARSGGWFAVANTPGQLFDWVKSLKFI